MFFQSKEPPISKFCTSCGAAYSGNSFCTSCGAVQSVVEPTPAESTSIDTPKVLETSDAQLRSDGATQESQSDNATITKSKKKLILVAIAAIVFAGSSSGAYFLGKSSIDLEKEKKMSYDSGYDSGESSGESAGYSRGESAGYSRGYSVGETAGCEGIFSFSDGTYDYVTPYNPYNYYNRYPGSKYYAKSDC